MEKPREISDIFYQFNNWSLGIKQFSFFTFNLREGPRLQSPASVVAPMKLKKTAGIIYLNKKPITLQN